MDREAHVRRGVGGHHQVGGADGGAPDAVHGGLPTTLEALDHGAGVDGAAVTLDERPRQAVEVRQRFELRLVGEADCAAGVEAGDRRLVDQPDVGEPDADRRGQLLVQELGVAVRRVEKVASRRWNPQRSSPRHHPLDVSIASA